MTWKSGRKPCKEFIDLPSVCCFLRASRSAAHPPWRRSSIIRSRILIRCFTRIRSTHRPIHASYIGDPFAAVAHFARPGFHPLHAAIMGHVTFAHFTPAERAAWIRGNWHHAWYHGRYGWWWFAGGAWFWYAAPVYPYPTMVSDYYYEEPAYSRAGPTWYYCYNPPGYYPYVPSCYGPWRPVPPQGYGAEGVAPEQGPPPGYDQGPPPGYNQGPPPG